MQGRVLQFFYYLFIFFVPVQMIASLGHNRNVKPSAD